jgi:hypothetical protein
MACCDGALRVRYRFVKKNGRLPKFSDVKGSTTSKKDGGMEEPGISLNPTVAT